MATPVHALTMETPLGIVIQMHLAIHGMTASINLAVNMVS